MRVIWMAMILAWAALLAGAVEQQAYLGIFAETQVNYIAGMPSLVEVLGDGEGEEMPDLPMLGRPDRTLTVRLWSPGLAPEGATAVLAIPAGLKLGEKLDLELFRPQQEQLGAADEDQFNPDAITGFTLKRYWGSSPTVKAGQPEVLRWEAMTAEQKSAMKELARRAAQQHAYFYKSNWTTAYWPTPQQPGKIPWEAALAGTYRLTTSYTGTVAIDVPKEVNFLAPVELTSPKLDTLPPLDQPLVIKWKAIPGLLGSHATIFGMQGKNTLIIWDSAEVRPEMATDWDYLEMATVETLVKSTMMMPGERAEVTVPAGIFKDCDIAFFRMAGFGPGVALAQRQPLPRVQAKTTCAILLGGKGMAPVDLPAPAADGEGEDRAD